MSTAPRLIRVALGLTGILSALVAPPWVPFVCIVLLSLRFDAWEVLAIGLLMDFVWLPTHVSLEAFPLATFMAILVVWGCAPIRRELLERGPVVARPGWY
jgi:hypothetical protein